MFIIINSSGLHLFDLAGADSQGFEMIPEF